MKGRVLLILLVPVLFLAACSSTREFSKSPREPVEQLLLNDAVERSLSTLNVPMQKGDSVFVEAIGLSPDLPFIREKVASKLAEKGLRIQERNEEAQYLVRVLVESFGTVQEETFIGTRQVESSLLPLGLPELALYKKLRQTGHVRLAVRTYDRGTHQLAGSSIWHTGSSSYTQYTVFFLLVFRQSDLVAPP